MVLENRTYWVLNDDLQTREMSDTAASILSCLMIVLENATFMPTMLCLLFVREKERKVIHYELSKVSNFLRMDVFVYFNVRKFRVRKILRIRSFAKFRVFWWNLIESARLIHFEGINFRKIAFSNTKILEK